MKKKCIVCNKEFEVDTSGKSCSTECKEKRISKYQKQWYQQNKEKVRISNCDKQYKYRTTRARYYQQNKKIIGKKQNQYQKDRLKTDINFKLTRNLRTRLSNTLNREQKDGSAIKDLGCTLGKLKSHLESQFQDGMSWDNYGKWHIDHIKPLSRFDLRNREELLRACHYTNLQPLWAKDNRVKSDKV